MYIDPSYVPVPYISISHSIPEMSEYMTTSQSPYMVMTLKSSNWTKASKASYFFLLQGASSTMNSSINDLCALLTEQTITPSLLNVLWMLNHHHHHHLRLHLPLNPRTSSALDHCAVFVHP
mmetsp:Transcript_37103/g.44852  ORF Transcript_37103/g.44852 Transcript_37103/m.44852 type:complete len:121 (-) Transcript_37103:804-1166(-)